MTTRPPGRIKVVPEDFVVEELPLYAPSGQGDHVFVRFTKRDLTTDVAVRAICQAVGADVRQAGIAGMKDKRAVTTQTISIQPPKGMTPEALITRLRDLSLDSITIHEATRHPHKLKTGHLAGNRFALRVRGVPRDRIGEAVEVLERVGREGFPNAFGAQRFGREGDNVERALAWLRGRERGPRDPRMQRLLWSSVQSKVFNAVLERRVNDGTWATPLAGDLLKKRDSGGLFLCSDVQVDRARAATGEVSPTGPLVGVDMRPAEGEPGELERRICAEVLGESFDFSLTKRLGEGGRRPLRVWVEGLRVERLDPEGPAEEDAGIQVYFVLPRGAYATTVMEMAFSLGETAMGPDASTDDGPSRPERELSNS